MTDLLAYATFMDSNGSTITFTHHIDIDTQSPIESGQQDNTASLYGNTIASVLSWSLVDKSAELGSYWNSYSSWINLHYDTFSILCTNTGSFSLSAFGVYINKLSITADVINHDAFNIGGISGYINEINLSAYEIGRNAFKDCSMAEFNIDTTIISIDEGSFLNCKKLESISLDRNIVFKSRAFEGCESLSRFNGYNNEIINLPTGSTSVFKNCYYLTHFAFPDDTNVAETYHLGSCFYLDYTDHEYSPGSGGTSITTNIRKIADYDWSGNTNRGGLIYKTNGTHFRHQGGDVWTVSYDTPNDYYIKGVMIYSDIEYLLFTPQNDDRDDTWYAIEAYPNTIGWYQSFIDKSAVVKHSGKYYYLPFYVDYNHNESGIYIASKSDGNNWVHLYSELTHREVINHNASTILKPDGTKYDFLIR